MTRWLGIFVATWKFGARLFMFSVVHLVGFIVAAQLTGMANHENETASTAVHRTSRQPTDDDKALGHTEVSNTSRAQVGMLGMVMLVCVLNSAVLMMWIQRSTLYGISLVAGVFAVFFMCMTVMPQSETLFFLPHARDIVRHASTMGLVVCALFALASVPVMHRWRIPNGLCATSWPGRDTVLRWVGRFAIGAVGYVALYLVFGYFVAWQNPEVRTLYGGGELRGFLSHLSSRPVATGLIPFQFVRGIVWTSICFAMLRFSQGKRLSQAVVVALVLAVLMNAQLLIPNPLMSSGVRITHLVETSLSNFLFGFLCVLFLTSTRRPG